MIFFINYSKDKINIYSFNCPPFLFVRAQQSFVCQPVSRDSGAGAGWLTIEKWFLLLINCALRHDLPAVFLILRLPSDRSGSLSGVSVWCLLYRPVFSWPGATSLKDFRV